MRRKWRRWSASSRASAQHAAALETLTTEHAAALKAATDQIASLKREQASLIDEHDRALAAKDEYYVAAHSGALAERPVLPPEANSWSSTAANRSLAAVALSQPNSDLKELYMRHQRVSSAVDATMANTATRGARLMRRAKQRP